MGGAGGKCWREEKIIQCFILIELIRLINKSTLIRTDYPRRYNNAQVCYKFRSIRPFWGINVHDLKHFTCSLKTYIYI